MRTLDRISIYALSFAVVGLVIALLMQKQRKEGNTGEIAPTNAEHEAFSQHLSNLNKTLKEKSKLRRVNRLGDKEQ